MAQTNFPASGVQTLTSLTGTENMAVDAGGPVFVQATTQLTGSLWSKNATVDQSASGTTVAGGFSVTFSGLFSTMFISLTQLAATGTVTLASNPVNGQFNRFSINQNVTALTVTASTTSISINNAPSTASTASAGGFMFIYRASDTAWYRF